MLLLWKRFRLTDPSLLDSQRAIGSLNQNFFNAIQARLAIPLLSESMQDGQPFVVTSGVGMALSHSKKMILLMLFPIAAVAAAPEPTEAEILALTEKDVSSANQPVIEYQKKIGKNEVPPDMLVKVNSVRKIGCKPTEHADTYLCDVEMDLTVPNGGRRTRIVPVRFAKTDDGWKGSR